MSELNPNNPLSAITAFNPAPVDNKALQDLQSKSLIAAQQNRGAMDRQVLSGQDAFARALVPHGFTPDTAEAGLPELRKELQFKNLLGASGEAKSKGLHPIIPEGGVNVSGLPDLNIVHGPTAGVAQARATAETLAKIAETTTLEDVADPSGTQVGILSKRKIEKKRELSGKVKAVDPAQAQGVVNRVAKKLNLSGKAAKEVTVIAGKSEIDGSDVWIVKVKGPPPRKFEVAKDKVAK
jgi:hypothetical protein